MLLTSVNLHGVVVSQFEDIDVTSRGFCMAGTQGACNVDDGLVWEESISNVFGSYSHVYSPLPADTFYWVRAVVRDSESNIAYSEFSYFRTSTGVVDIYLFDTQPGISQKAIHTMVQITKPVYNNGLLDPTDVRLYYSTGSNPLLGDYLTLSVNDFVHVDGTFATFRIWDKIIPNLLDNTTYFIQAKCTSLGGITYSDIRSFTTIQAAQVIMTMSTDSSMIDRITNLTVPELKYASIVAGTNTIPVINYNGWSCIFPETHNVKLTVTVDISGIFLFTNTWRSRSNDFYFYNWNSDDKVIFEPNPFFFTRTSGDVAGYVNLTSATHRILIPGGTGDIQLQQYYNGSWETGLYYTTVTYGVVNNYQNPSYFNKANFDTFSSANKYWLFTNGYSTWKQYEIDYFTEVDLEDRYNEYVKFKFEYV